MPRSRLSTTKITQSEQREKLIKEGKPFPKSWSTSYKTMKTRERRAKLKLLQEDCVYMFHDPTTNIKYVSINKPKPVDKKTINFDEVVLVLS